LQNGNNDQAILDLALFVIGSSRTVIDETPRYAAFRMLQIFQRVAKLQTNPRDMRFLEESSDAISKNDEILMRGKREEFVQFLESLVAKAAEEVKTRNQEESS